MPDRAFGQDGATRSILERLVGDTGEPDKVAKSARSLAERSLGGMRAAIAEGASRPVGVELAAVEVDRMANLAQGAGPYDAITVAASSASPDAVALRLDPAAIGVLVDALFGAGDGSAPARADRPPSALELDIAAYAFDAVARALDGAGARALQIRFPLPAPQPSQEARKAVMRDGPSVRIDYRLGVAPHTGLLTVMMPQRVVLKPRAAEPREDHDPAAAQWSARFGEEVMRSTVKLEATIPAGRMTLGAIAALQPGQVIELSETAPAETRLSARDKTLFVCEFGRLGQNYTVRIKGPFGTEGDTVEGSLFP